MILLDTTILVYAVGSEHPLRDACRNLLASQAEGILDATTTIEVIQEFVHVHARRRPRSEAVAVARDYVKALSPFATTIEDLTSGLDLFDSHSGLGAFDSVLAAVALARRATLVSADHSFAAVPGLKWIDPQTPAVEALVRP